LRGEIALSSLPSDFKNRIKELKKKGSVLLELDEEEEQKQDEADLDEEKLDLELAGAIGEDFSDEEDEDDEDDETPQ